MSINVSVVPGTSSITVGVSNLDPPASHAHGNITNDGKIGTTGGYVVGTVSGGVIDAISALNGFHVGDCGTDNFLTDDALSAVIQSIDYAISYHTHSSTAISNVISSPSQITSNQNNYTLGTAADIFRISSNAARDITGVVAGGSGDAKVLLNVGAYDITLKHQSSSSTAANRFLCAGGSDFVLAADSSCCIIYDSTTSRWRVG